MSKGLPWRAGRLLILEFSNQISNMPSRSERYLKERGDFISRARRLLPWLTPARLTYLAYYADTEEFSPVADAPSHALFGQVRMLRRPELRELGTLLRFKPEPPWIERRIPKRSGSSQRILYVPNVPLKQLHRFVLRAHLDRLPVDRAAYGFEKGRCRRQHAAHHCNQYVVVRIDIRRFFPSIEATRLESIFAECGFRTRFGNVLSQLVTYHNRLPQGAPTSPKLADLVSRPLDSKMRTLAKQRRWSYSRYADDISLSCGREISSQAIGETIAAAEEVIESEGFNVNKSKTRVMKHHTRQLVAGAIVNNAKPDVPREKRRRVRAIIHNCKANGLVKEALHYKQQVQDQYERPRVVDGRHPGEKKRNDRIWPYERQVRFMSQRYLDPLIAYPPEEWPWLYDFWHYLSGLVGEINSLNPGLGRELRRELRTLKLGHTDVEYDLSHAEESVQEFWNRAADLVAEINVEARGAAGTSRFINFPPVSPEAKIRVARSGEGLLAFCGDVYRQILDGMHRGHRKWLYKVIEEEEPQGRLQDLRFAVELRHDHAHTDPGSEREAKRHRIVESGFARLTETIGQDENVSAYWMELQQRLSHGILEDLEYLRDRIASRGLD